MRQIITKKFLILAIIFLQLLAIVWLGCACFDQAITIAYHEDEIKNLKRLAVGHKN
jgi:hypothetical protein